MGEKDAIIIDLASRRTSAHEYLTVKEVAAELSLSVSTIYRRIRRLGFSFKIMVSGRMVIVLNRTQLLEISALTKRSKEEDVPDPVVAGISYISASETLDTETNEISEMIASNERLLASRSLRRTFSANND